MPKKSMKKKESKGAGLYDDIKYYGSKAYDYGVQAYDWAKKKKPFGKIRAYAPGATALPYGVGPAINWLAESGFRHRYKK